MAKRERIYSIDYSIHGGAATKSIIIRGAKSKKDALKKADKKMVPSPDPMSAITVTRVKGDIIHSVITPAEKQNPDRGNSNIDTIQTGGNSNL